MTESSSSVDSFAFIWTLILVKSLDTISKTIGMTKMPRL